MRTNCVNSKPNFRLGPSGHRVHEARVQQEMDQLTANSLAVLPFSIGRKPQSWNAPTGPSSYSGMLKRPGPACTGEGIELGEVGRIIKVGPELNP